MSKLYVPLGVKEFVIACFKVTEANSILYRRYKTIEGLQQGIYDAIMKGADYISLRIIKEGSGGSESTASGNSSPSSIQGAGTLSMKESWKRIREPAQNRNEEASF